MKREDDLLINTEDPLYELELSPEVKMWREVITQAEWDAHNGKPTNTETLKAQRWLLSPGSDFYCAFKNKQWLLKEESDFKFVCSCAQVDWQVVHERAKRNLIIGKRIKRCRKRT